MSRQAHILDFDAVRARNAGLGSGALSARGRAREASAARSARAARRRQQAAFGWAALRRDHASAWEEAGYGYDPSYDTDRKARRGGYSSLYDEQDSVRRYDYYESEASAEDSYDDYDEEQAPLSKRERRRQARQKRKAERAYNRAVDNSPRQENEGPRAAFYQMKMGGRHKRAAAQASSASGSRAHFRGFHLALPSLPRAVQVLLGAMVCLVLLGAFLYPAAQNYYVAKRDFAKTEAAFAAVQERNALLEADVAALETPEGIADRARQEYGWVLAGEHAVTVTGRHAGSSSAFQKLEELPAVESIRAPRTWYSDVLDPFFGYAG